MHDGDISAKGVLEFHVSKPPSHQVFRGQQRALKRPHAYCDFSKVNKHKYLIIKVRMVNGNRGLRVVARVNLASVPQGTQPPELVVTTGVYTIPIEQSGRHW